MSGAIVKSPDVRVEEIALRVWGRWGESRFRKEGSKKQVGSYHAFLLFTFDLEQLSWHGE